MDEVEHDGELDMVLASQLVQDLQLGCAFYLFIRAHQT